MLLNISEKCYFVTKWSMARNKVAVAIYVYIYIYILSARDFFYDYCFYNKPLRMGSLIYWIGLKKK